MSFDFGDGYLGNAIDGWKVAIYIRWSTEEQSKGTTLEVQLESCKKFVEANGLHVNDKLIFIDDGYSGANLDRPALNKMRKMIQEGLIDFVVVYKLDRLSRSMADNINLVIREWDGKAVFRSVSEPFDTSTSMGKQLFYTLSSFSELERDTIKERTFSGKVKRAKEGRAAGFRIPYGFVKGKEKGTLVVVPEEAEIIKRIFNQYISGDGIGKIVKSLNEEGLTKRGNLWKVPSIHYILKNPIYKGELNYGTSDPKARKEKKKGGRPFYRTSNPPLVKIEQTDMFDPPITPEVFERVQELLASRNLKAGGSAPRTKNEHILATIARCGKCGYKLVAQKQRRKNGKLYEYYKCTGNHSGGKTVCTSGAINRHKLESLVMDDLRRTFMPSLDTTSIVDSLISEHENRTKQLESEISIISSDLSKKQSNLERIRNDYKNGHLTVSEYREFSKDLEKAVTLQKKSLSEKEQILAAHNKRNIVNELTELQSALTEWDKLPSVKQREILSKWIW